MTRPVSLLDGKYAHEWEALVPSSTAPSQRATTSSRTPGRVNTGTVWFAVSPIVTCPDCKRPMLEMPGVHAPYWRTPSQVVDCIGRPCSIGPDGYYRVELATTNDTREAA